MKNVVVGASVAAEPADDASTRQRVLDSLLQQGPLTASELSEQLGLTPAAIRRHLGALEEQGLVSSAQRRVYGQRGRGRPSRVFALTDEGRSAFHQAYDDLAIAAIRHLATHGGPGAVEAFADQRVAKVEVYYQQLRSERPELSPIETLAEALSLDGYAATISPARHGEQLCQHHCPIAHVAEQFPQLCQAETEAFSRLLGSHVQRLATIAHGDGVCTTSIPRVEQTSADSVLSPRKA